jgi:hypothetical protein
MASRFIEMEQSRQNGGFANVGVIFFLENFKYKSTD